MSTFRGFIPLFADYEKSERCHTSCEYAVIYSECDCRECGGLNHGRTAHYLKAWAENGHKQFWDKGKTIDVWENGPLRWFMESYQ